MEEVAFAPKEEDNRFQIPFTKRRAFQVEGSSVSKRELINIGHEFFNLTTL